MKKRLLILCVAALSLGVIGGYGDTVFKIRIHKGGEIWEHRIGYIDSDNETLKQREREYRDLRNKD